MFKLCTVILFVGLIQLAVSQPCPFAYSSDGYIYDLTDLTHMVQSYTIVKNGQYITYNASICRASPYPCAGSCADPFSAGVCQEWSQSAKCYGQFLSSYLEGLPNGEGVRIFYFGGDLCDSCSPEAPITSVITLLCNSNVKDSTRVKWTSVAQNSMTSNLYLNGDIKCTIHYAPSPNTNAPTSESNTVTIKYWGAGDACNRDKAYLITINRTATCTPGCELINGEFVKTFCDIEDLYLSGNHDWIETINYGDDYTCTTPQYAIYTTPKHCLGAFNSTYQVCDRTTVYDYSCPSSDCSKCTMIAKHATNKCDANNTDYTCLFAIKRNSVVKNPLF